VDSWRATVELMSEEETERRRRQAKEAELRGAAAGAYWKDVPEIPTVGHFTSMAGALVGELRRRLAHRKVCSSSSEYRIQYPRT
jgi:hypothetical protein